MRAKFSFAAILVCTGLCSLRAQDEEPQPTTNLEVTAAQIGHELIGTLTAAFEIRFAEFTAGRGDAQNTIRINRELYKTQRAHVDANQRQNDCPSIH